MITGKRRTRQHIIADLAINHFEQYVLLNGHTVQRWMFDYGYDLVLQTFDGDGVVEPSFAMIQVKATDSPTRVNGETDISFVVGASDLVTWCAEKLPVLLIVYDARDDVAYWLRINNGNLVVPENQTHVSLRVPITNRVDGGAVEMFRREIRQEIGKELD